MSQNVTEKKNQSGLMKRDKKKEAEEKGRGQ